jgi:hypothetical protein
VTETRFWSVFCEDVRIEHDQRCSLIGVMPTVAIGDEAFKFRQLCLVYSTEFPFSVKTAKVSHKVTVIGDIQGLEGQFLQDTYEFRRPDNIAGEDLWQVITYITSEKVEISGNASVTAEISVGRKKFISDLRFYQSPDALPT